MSGLKRAGDWLEERTGWRAGRRSWLDHPVVGGAPWAAAMAASVATCFGVLALTGLVLMTAYSASPQTAWASVHYVQFVQDRGWVVRGLHHWASDGLLVLAVVQVAHGAMSAGYRKPREVAWWLTLGLVAVVAGECITGGVLPWDERGWWARVVEGNIVGLAPWIGGWIQRMMQGGTELGALGLSRLYTLHVAVLPVLVGAMIWARGAQMRRHGWSDDKTTVSPWRDHLLRGAVVGALVVAVVFAVTGTMHGASLEAPADPLGDYPARPEWYLMPLYQLRKVFHGAGEFFGTTLAPLVAGVYLALLPWIEKRSRPWLLRTLVVGIFAGAIGFGAFASRKDARDPVYLKQRANADRRAAAAARLAMPGVPPEGALAMLRADPELRGRDLFAQHCASCHVLEDLGDPEKATATKLDGWGTAKWIEAMIHDPDAPEHFGRGPYKGKMPSVDVRPADKANDAKWKPMIKSDADRHALAAFLASLGAEPDEAPAPIDDGTRATGEKIVTGPCSTCHLYKGDGDLEGSEEAPELARYGSLAWTAAQVANPATDDTYRKKALDESMKKHMPRFDQDLSKADIELVARWTRAHGRGTTLP
jgi:ubiquinol-cytochrome c reductase cytochrome b subunit